MLRDWLCYLKDSSPDHFTTLVDSWSFFYSLKYRNKYGGPLLSPKPIVILEEWGDLDLAFSGYELSPDSNIPEKEHIKRLKSCNTVQVNGKNIPFCLEKRKEWRSVTRVLRLTNGQKRWFTDYKLDVNKLFRVWRKCKLPQYIKCWYFDAMHIVLAVRYKREFCCVCGDLIRSHHFVYGCKGIPEISKLITSFTSNWQTRFTSAYLAFRLHCLLKHSDANRFSKWRVILNTVFENVKFECELVLSFGTILYTFHSSKTNLSK